MKTNQALKIIGGLSRPSKMPGWSYGLPAKECKTGSKLRKVKDSVCYNCYALKGCYVFKVVQAAQYRRLDSIKNPGWVSAMVILAARTSLCLIVQVAPTDGSPCVQVAPKVAGVRVAGIKSFRVYQLRGIKALARAAEAQIPSEAEVWILGYP